MAGRIRWRKVREWEMEFSGVSGWEDDADGIDAAERQWRADWAETHGDDWEAEMWRDVAFVPLSWRNPNALEDPGDWECVNGKWYCYRD